MQKIFFILISTILLLPNIASAETANLTKIDSDQDGLFDAEEINIYYTDPQNPDTDGDGFSDGQEISEHYSPLNKDLKLVNTDTDKDGLNDRWELIIGTDIKNPDTDDDGFSDWDEVYAGYNPKSSEKQKLAKIIEVDLKQQILRYTFDGKILDQFHISSGVAGKRTPKGEFAILDKVPVKTYGGKGYDYYYPNTKWNLHFTTGYARFYIHGAYWHHNFGHPMSHGCVNVAYHNMENLYNWANVGTKVLIY